MRTKTDLPATFIVPNTVFFWLATAIAAAVWWPIYQDLQFVLLVAVTVLVASAVAILGALYRLQSHVVLIATVVAYLLLGVPLAIPDRTVYSVLPSVQGMLDLFTATVLGWKQLITITLPVGNFQSLLVPIFVLVLLATVVGLSVALRATRGDLALIPPLLLFISGILFGPAEAFWPLLLSLGLLVICLIWLVWLHWYRRRASIRLLSGQTLDASGRKLESNDRLGYRASIGATITIAIAATASFAATSALPPTHDRQVLRTSVEQPFDPRDYPSPLSGFRSYHQEASASQSMFTVIGLPSDGRIRIATLDTYDGIAYTVGSEEATSESGSFTRVPTTFDQSKLDGVERDLQITIDKYEGVWLPTIGKLESVRFTSRGASALRESFFYNDNSGTAVVVGELESGDSYDLTVVMPKQPDLSELATLEPGPAVVPEIGTVPEELAVTLGRYIGDKRGSGAQLKAMIDGLRRDGYISHGITDEEPPSRSGHSSDRITQLLTEQRMIGDDEQYAVAGALMATELGFPARVVFGFEPDNINADGVTLVRGGDVAAWVEVNTRRYGWVAIDPTPDVRDIPDEQPEDPAQVARPQSPVQPPLEEPEPRLDQLQPDTTQDAASQPNLLLEVLLAIAQVLGFTVIGLAIVLSPFMAIAIAKIRRRMIRRKAASALDRVRGGWQEFEDAALDHGYTPPAAPTRIEVARTVGGVRSLVLASITDRAVFSPETTLNTEADQVWKSVDELRASLDEGFTRWQRMKAAVSVKSLGGYSVKRLFRR